jgi:hypothetical protein
MVIINESALYKFIMRSNKPLAESFQEFVCEDILPSIRKKGIYKLENESKFALQRPIKHLFNLTEIDIEAEIISLNYDWSLYTNDCVLYIAYIGQGYIKLGFSDCRIIERELKHTGCESQFEQFRMLKVFVISGKEVEDKMKKLLKIYNVIFNKQTEIYKPPGTLAQFIQIIETLLRDNDLKMSLELATKEIMELKLKYSELEKKMLENKF